MYKIPANTLFMGKNLVFVPECPSTNTLALEIGQQSPAKEGTVVITDHQTAGKGQRGNTWDAEPSQNLTFSLILRPGFLPVNKQFYLNIVISLGLYNYLKEKTSDPVYIKWPNDILVHGKKVSGILVENQLKGMQISNTIAGIGFNLNQKVFASSSAISLSQVIGTTLDRHEELPLLLGHIESRYLQLRQACMAAPSGDYQPLMDDYLAALYRRHEKHLFSANGALFEGTIHDIDEWGKLRVETSNGFRSFGIKEISYVD